EVFAELALRSPREELRGKARDVALGSDGESCATLRRLELVAHGEGHGAVECAQREEPRILLVDDLERRVDLAPEERTRLLDPPVPACRALHPGLPGRQVRDVGEVREDLLLRAGDLHGQLGAHETQDRLEGMLDDRVRAVLERLEREDADERAQDVPREQRARQVEPTTGRLLFSFVAPQTDCEVLELGGSRGYSTIWLPARCRHLRGRGLSPQNRPGQVRSRGGRVLWRETARVRVETGRANVEEAGLSDWAELVPGDAFETLPEIDDVFDVVFLDAEKELYERLFAEARDKLEPGAVVIADNVLSPEEVVGAYSRARQADPTLESVTVPLDRGLEISAVLRNR